MKRDELIRRLRKAAKAQGVTLELRREGAGHEIWSFGDRDLRPIPRHREIAEGLAQAILREAGVR